MEKENIISVRPTKVVYRSGDKIVKSFVEGYLKSDVLNEALNQARVEEIGLNIPKVISVDVIDNRWTITSEYIEGETLDSLMRKHPEKEEEYLQLMVDLQLDVLSRKCPLLHKLKDKLRRKLKETAFDDTVKYDLNTALEGTPKHDKLCHGDFNPSNIVITEDGKKYILDWAHASQGNASADAAQSYLILYLNYGGIMAEKYLNLFVAQSGIAKKTIQKWLPVVAAAKTLNCQEEELDFLNRWVNVVEYE